MKLLNPLRRVLVFAGLLGGAAALAVPARPLAAQAPAALPAYAPGQVIVQFKAGAGAAQRDAALAQAAARAGEHIHTPAMQADGAPGLLVAATQRPVAEAVRILQAHPAVEFAEPNWVLRHQATSNDPYYTGGSLWGMFGDGTSPANAYGSGAGEAWAAGHTGSDTVYVGIIDEGIQYSHPDLQANIWTNPYDPVDGVDNDGNGYVDDVHGWDFYHRDNSVYDAGEDHHGTHVAGTIGGTGGNGAGVAGVVWNVRMISGKFLGPDGGYLSDAVKAVDYFTNLKRQHGLNIVATNNSWGGGSYSQALHDAIIRAARQNILFIAAAGNGGADQVGDNNDAYASYPSNYDTSRATTTEPAAGYDSVVAVAALDRYGNLGSFSNYGATTVDLAAPGVSIYSTLPDNTYGAYSGTSMATPHVTGAVALYAAANPSASAAEIRSALLNGVTPTASVSGKTLTGGRLNVGDGFLAVATPTHDLAVTAVSAPASVTQGAAVSVSVTVRNEGNSAEAATVSLADDPGAGGTAGSAGAAQSVNLAAGASVTLNFAWNTSGASLGNHALTATVGGVSGETDLADNSRTANSNVVAASASLSVSSISPSSMKRGTSVTVVVTGTGFAPGASLAFQNGEGAQPVAGSVSVAADGTSLTATVRVGTSGPKRNRYWDVVVTNPNGQSSRLSRGLTVTP